MIPSHIDRFTRLMSLRAPGTFASAFIVVFGGFAIPQISSAQGTISVVRSGSFEVGGFAGASYGADRSRFIGGGNVTYAINRWILPYAEYSYFPGVARSAAIPGLNATANFSTPLSDFHGGVHIRLPIRERPIVPYLVGGVGGLSHFEHTYTSTYTGPDGLPHTTLPTVDPRGTDLAFNFGAGIRYYRNERFGFRLEAKGYRTNNPEITPIFGKVEIGFFYQLH